MRLFSGESQHVPQFDGPEGWRGSISILKESNRGEIELPRQLTILAAVHQSIFLDKLKRKRFLLDNHRNDLSLSGSLLRIHFAISLTTT